MNEEKSKSVMVLLVLVLAALMVDAVITLRFARSRPCLAIPTRFILEYPECAEKLVEAMNISDVHIVPHGTSVAKPIG